MGPYTGNRIKTDDSRASYLVVTVYPVYYYLILELEKNVEFVKNVL